MRSSDKKGRRKKHEATDEQRILLDQLKETAIAVGIEVREEKLSRGAGYNVRSGPCRVGDREVVFLDSGSTASERIDVLVEVLADCDLEGVWLEPRLRRLIQGEQGPTESADPN